VSQRLNRRDFLKLVSLAPFALALPPQLHAQGLSGQGADRKNVLVVVFDAFSARNMSVFGYPRDTTPNISRLAKRAVVYRNHYAAGNFTSSGTASILTGVYPWTHQAIQYRGRVNPRFDKRNVFTVFEDYYRFAYTHNPWAYIVLRPLASQMEQLLPVEELYLQKGKDLIGTVLANDEDIARVSWSRATRLDDDGYGYSLLLSHIVTAEEVASRPQDILRLYPRGLPGCGDTGSFLLETAVDWLPEQVTRLPQPFFGYFHLLPPHAPYRTRLEYMDRFKGDGYEPLVKPPDLFATGEVKEEAETRRAYDEFVLYVDAQFGRLYDALETSGVLEDTWLILTSDHGETFERGLVEHGTRTLYEPEIRVPLLVFEPGRDAGEDIHVPTSTVDLLPTLAHLTGHPVPNWTEGTLLPRYASQGEGTERGIYSLMANDNDPAHKIHAATSVIIKGDNKLHYYFAYHQLENRELLKLFDLAADPEEMVDLSSSRADVATGLLAELKAQLAEADRRYP
jgi:arylsulfatase A-like enzyme